MTTGNQQALSNFLCQAIQRVQSGDVAGAIDKIQKAIERTDGCPKHGEPDGSRSKWVNLLQLLYFWQRWQ